MPLPRVSILMSVYNGEDFLQESIESTLNQSFQDFEFLVINDGSTDRSVEVIRSYHDPRIRLINNPTNLGQSRSLNRGFDISRGEYVAHLDCDDVNSPDRLTRQVAFMDTRRDVGICVSWVKTIGKHRKRIKRYPVAAETVRCYMPFANPVAHSAVMMRREQVVRYNLRYNVRCHFAEDLELWVRCVDKFRICNIGEVLVRLRRHPQQRCRVYQSETNASARAIQTKVLKESGLLPEDRAFEASRWIHDSPAPKGRESILRTAYWLQRLSDANRDLRIFPEPDFNEVLGWVWLRKCKNAKETGIWVWKTYRQSHLSRARRCKWMSNFGWGENLELPLRRALRR